LYINFVYNKRSKMLFLFQQGLSQRTLRYFVLSATQGPVPETLLKRE